MRVALALVLAAACSGTAGVRDHSEPLVVAAHCRSHRCPTPPQPRGLGDGCYVVGDALYQCSTDQRPHGEASCFEIPSCAGACEVTISDDRGREISIERCRDRWRADREERRPPPRCAPARLQVAIGSASVGAPSALPLPAALVIDVTRSGKTAVVYEAEVCPSQRGVVVGEATRATGFAALDRVLRARLGALALPSGGCVTVTLVASQFACEVEQTLD